MGTPSKDFEGLRPAAFSFLRELARNNRRPWFEAHRDQFESEVREPVRALIEALDVRLAKIAPEISADPKRSVFRIHRDIRFSKDKSPYKKHVGFWITHRRLGGGGGPNVHGGAGLYFHFQPGASMVAAGIWMPPPPVLARIRGALTDDVRGFERALRAVPKKWGRLSEEAVLRRLPRGFAADDPAERWLRYRSFTVSHPLAAAELRRPGLPDILAREFKGVIPLVRWLNSALGLPPDRSR
jgi:uncharacterized protein (TIGR02453 family)